jgi:hypothetical protein
LGQFKTIVVAPGLAKFELVLATALSRPVRAVGGRWTRAVCHSAPPDAFCGGPSGLLAFGGGETARGMGIWNTSPHCLQRDFLPASEASTSYRFAQPGQSSTINIVGSPALPQNSKDREARSQGPAKVHDDFTVLAANKKTYLTDSRTFVVASASDQP